MDIYKKNYFKFFVGIVACLLFRLIPFRPPNIEPILTAQMPFSKRYGPYVGFFFAFLSIILFDLVTQTLGAWTLFTASAYGLLGFFAFSFFKKKKPTRLNFVYFAIIGTLFFDITTGLTVGPLLFGQSFTNALVGQIPFTLWHLLGNISFSFLLSPAIYKLLVKEKKIKTVSIINTLNPKTI